MATKSGNFRFASSSTTVVISLALVLFMLGLAGWAMLNFRNLTNTLKEEFGFQVIINEKATEANIQTLRKELDASLFVKEAEYIAKEVAAEEMKKELGEDFVEFLGIEFFIHDIILTGSLANYNWSNFSDVDLHIVIDFEDSEYDSELLKEFFDSKKNL